MPDKWLTILVFILALILVIGVYYGANNTHNMPTSQETTTTSTNNTNNTDITTTSGRVTNITTTTSLAARTNAISGQTTNTSRYGIVEIFIEGSVKTKLYIIVTFNYAGVGSRDFFFTVEDLPARLTVNFSKELAEAEKIYNELLKELEAKGGSHYLPTINIKVMYDDGNKTRSKLILYSTLDYYNEPEVKRELEEKGIEPWEASLSDPFKPFREGKIVVRINLDKLFSSS